jgi:hypothetical protein
VQVNVLWAYQVAALCLAGSAWAQAPRQVRLEYARQDGAGACPDGAAIQAGVAARLGYEPFDDRADDLVRASIQPSGHGLEARIALIDAKGSPKAERRLVSRQRDCAELASSVALAISIAIDPFGLGPAPAGPGARAPEEPEQAASPSPPQVSVVSSSEPVAASRPRPLASQVGAALVGGLGAAPSPTLGLAASVGMRGGNLSLGLEGRVDLPASTSLRVGEASTALLVASLVPCAHVGRVATCALFSAGALRAAGHGLVDSRTVTLPYAALGARVALAIPVTARWSLAMHGDVTAPLTTSKLAVDGATVWTSPMLSAALGLGVAATFP